MEIEFALDLKSLLGSGARVAEAPKSATPTVPSNPSL
jgi:hypothetical protein